MNVLTSTAKRSWSFNVDVNLCKTARYRAQSEHGLTSSIVKSVGPSENAQDQTMRCVVVKDYLAQ